jgi:hypothetical protein
MRLIFIILMFFFIGCGDSKYIYWDLNVKKKSNKEIAVSLSFPDYMKAGYLVAKEGNEFIFLNKQIPERVESFYGGYLKKSLLRYGFKVKIYPWEFDYIPKKVYNIAIIDYYIDLKNKEVLLKAECCKKIIFIKKSYRNDYLKSYRDVFDIFIKKLGGMI